MFKVDLLNSPGIQRNISKKSVDQSENREKEKIGPPVLNKKPGKIFGFLTNVKFKEVMISVFLISVLVIGYYFNEKIVYFKINNSFSFSPIMLSITNINARCMQHWSLINCRTRIANNIIRTFQ